MVFLFLLHLPQSFTPHEWSFRNYDLLEVVDTSSLFFFFYNHTFIEKKMTEYMDIQKKKISPQKRTPIIERGSSQVK